MTSSFLAVAKKVERRSEGFGLWKKLTWKGPLGRGRHPGPMALDKTFLLDSSPPRYG